MHAPLGVILKSYFLFDFVFDEELEDTSDCLVCKVSHNS